MFPTHLLKVPLGLQCNRLPEIGSREAPAFQEKAERMLRESTSGTGKDMKMASEVKGV